MRFLLVNNHCITDPTTGVTQSLRTITKWLADAGHDGHVLTTARLESRAGLTIEDHLRQLGVEIPAPGPAGTRPDRTKRGQDGRRSRPIVRYATDGVPVTLLMTRHHNETRPDRVETAQFEALVERLLDEFAPDQLIACNAHPMVNAAMAKAQERGVTTAFAVRSFGYYDRRYFEHANHVFTCSQFLTDHYRDRVGVESTPIHPPIEWKTVLAPTDSRAFLTFVHPAPHKGLMLFARLADMLGSRRPDIPILVVQSGQTAGSLNNIPGIDFSKYPQIMAAPAVPRPADYFALTRILLVPSVLEAFGRVAAEAMINGIPPIVSNRGSLSDVINGDFATGGGGRVVSLPDWMTYKTLRLPSEAEVEPWYEAVCALWDDSALYDAMAARARQLAEERYSEQVSRRQHVDYFTSLTPGASPIPGHRR